MRKLVTYHLCTVDGVAEAPERWVFAFDREMKDYLGAVIASQDAVLLGRTTYEAWASYWPTSSDEPFASFINGTAKYVASTTLADVAWSNSTLIRGNLVDELVNMQAESGNDIGVHGSVGLTRSLLGADIVDELRLAVMPVLAGAGARIFDGDDLRRLRLMSSQPTSSGCLLLTYRRQRD